MTKATKVALFGANGELGSAILHALLTCKRQPFEVTAVVRPNSPLKYQGDRSRVTAHEMGVSKATEEDIAHMLQGIDVVISALGHNVVESQETIQNAAALAGVKRFYPSEYGMQQLAFVKGLGAVAHPVWAKKMEYCQKAMKHPAIEAGQMSYTIVGCGEMYDLAKEAFLCPWTQSHPEGYTIHTVGNPDARMDVCSRHDVASFVASSLCRPEASENRIINLRGEQTSWNEMARSLRHHSGLPVHVNVIPFEQATDWIQNPSHIPSQLHGESSFPLGFCLLVRLVEGQGDFWRPPGRSHNAEFPAQVTPFDSYLN